MTDEPCADCGQPGTSQGHGLYLCDTCEAAQWCPRCRYALWPEPHRCVPLLTRWRRRLWWKLEPVRERLIEWLGGMP